MNTIPSCLTTIVTSLREVGDKAYNVSKESRTFAELFGGRAPALDRTDLHSMANSLADRMEKWGRGAELSENDIDSFEAINGNFAHLKSQIIPNLYSDSAFSVAYVSTIGGFEAIFNEVASNQWDVIEDQEMMPSKLLKKLSSQSARYDSIVSHLDDLDGKVKRINDAHDAADSFPADLVLIREWHTELTNIKRNSLALEGSIQQLAAQSKMAKDEIDAAVNDAKALVAQLKDLHRVGTSTTLAGAFQGKANSLVFSLWSWVLILVIALLAVFFIGHDRITEISKYMTSDKVNWDGVWINVVLTLLSVSPAIWLGWLASKQISQRFKLAEDYAYKASISNAYEGYRREAVGMDKEFQARLFGTALTRLEEIPIRLVDHNHHASPLHEFFNSIPFSEAMEHVKGFKDSFIDFLKANPRKESQEKAKGLQEDEEKNVKAASKESGE